ncbi:MAG TPA: alpha/beta hydrolase, partial [Actinomycetota bacterium]|nr:alpha/beta hydrolase [Actinomycetota bacterium]
MAHLDIGAAKLFYEDHGGGGAPVIFSHGFLMDHEMFAPQVAALASEFRCITWDQRGHGLTEAPGDFNYWDSAADLIALMDHLDLAHASLVGMSQGGYLSLRAALAAPERVNALVLIDSQAGPEDPSLRPVYDQIIDQWVSLGPDRQIAETIATFIVAPADPGPWIDKWMVRPARDVIPIYRALMERDDISDRVHAIGCPALVIHGEADGAISSDRGELLADLLPHCDGILLIP